jgi:CCR4-NOT transcriptional regulation complex NOT5 subunit
MMAPMMTAPQMKAADQKHLRMIAGSSKDTTGLTNPDDSVSVPQMKVANSTTIVGSSKREAGLPNPG